MNANNAKKILLENFGYNEFRDGQQEIIEKILSNHDVLGIMPTGSGKSICYQVPALVFDGITLVVSPLISLMHDQVGALKSNGIDAAYINSSLTEAQISKVIENAISGKYKLIYIAPERLENTQFVEFAAKANISMLTIDEAHCISQWGQDFRPSYLKIINFIDMMQRRPVISAFTATATEEVKLDIIKQLKLQKPHICMTGFDRPNLYFGVEKPKDKYAYIINYIKKHMDASGIIYCATRKAVEEVCKKLVADGYSATKYHAGLSEKERKNNQDSFIKDDNQIMVATNAFGMGIDKSNVSYVFHYNMPKNIESYYQEAGRAGRDGTDADCILLYSSHDIVINKFLIDSQVGNEELSPSEQEEVKARDRKRLNDILNFCHAKKCLRKFILNYFGDYSMSDCGNCSVCKSQFEEMDITIDSQKILSCVARLEGRFGLGIIKDILKGAKTSKISDYGLENNKSYGIMSDKPTSYIKEVVEYLCDEDIITLSHEKFQKAFLGDGAKDILFFNKQVFMRKNKNTVFDDNANKKTKSTKNSGYANDETLLKNLKALRKDIATKQNVPAYFVFTDATLIDMCNKLPQTLDELNDVSGVGKMKLEKYGNQFLDILISKK